MNKIGVVLFSIVLAFHACIRMAPGRAPAVEEGPYIDSTGYRASLARIDNVADQSAGTLIKQAIDVPVNTDDDATRPDFFQSLEDNYQRYLKLFRQDKKGKSLAVICNFDLPETFRTKLFDPQPFMNAILHTMTLREFTTLDYTIASDRSDTLLIRVSWAKPTALQTEKGFGITEGSLPLLVTRHSALLAEPFSKTPEIR